MTALTPTENPSSFLDVRRPPGAANLGLIGLGAALAVVSLGFVFYKLFTEGHAAFNTSSDMAWGAPIAYYVFFLLASSGLGIFASLDSVLGTRTFYPIAKRAVFLAICCLIAGFSLLALELGHPFRLLWAIPLGMQIRSPMFWMGALYSLELVLLATKFWFMHRENWHSPSSHTVSVASFVVAILAAGTLGLTFGIMYMRPAWNSNLMPMYFVLSGFTSAAAFLLFFTSLQPRQDGENVRRLYEETLPRLFFVALLAVIGVRAGQVVTGLWSNVEGMEAHWLQLESPLFWIEVAGLLVPAALMAPSALRRLPQVQFLAAALFVVGIFVSRLEMLIMGQRVPLFRGSWAGYVDYWPSVTEWMLIPAGVGLFLLVYGLGNWLLRLGEMSKWQHE